MSTEGCEQLAEELRSVLEYYGAEYDILYCQVVGVLEMAKYGGQFDEGDSPACRRLFDAISEIIRRHLDDRSVSVCDAVGLLEMVKTDVLMESIEIEGQDDDES